MDFSTPIRLVPATTAPLTTLATISADITRPSSPNATMKGTHGAIDRVSCNLTVRYDSAPRSEPRGSAERSESMSALTSAMVAALEKRYSIWLAAGVPGARSAAASAGSTQACAVWVIDVAKPTTSRRGDPGAPVTVTRAPTLTPGPRSSPSTTCPTLVGQWPDFSVRSSTGPPGDARPTTVSCVWNTPEGPDCPDGGPTGMVALTVVSGNGPAAAVTPGSRVVAASPAGEPATVAVTSEPCCAANA